MEIKCLPLGDYQANCYIVTDDTSMTAAIIDPGVASDELNDLLLGYDLKYILLTHGHFDHILYALCYIPMNYSFYNYRFVPVNPFTYFVPTPPLLSVY